MAEKSIAKTASREEELKKVSRAMLMRQLLPAVGLVAVFIVFNILTKGRMVSKFSLVMSQVYVTMIASTGVFFIMTMGGLDFSQGSILGMASIVVCMVSKVSIPLSILAGIGTGAAIGAMNGFFYVNRKIKSFIVTICTMFLFRGIIKYMTSNSPVMGDIKLTMLGMNETLKMICTLVVIVLGLLAFRFTKFGIHLKAIGAGEKAAKYAGIRTDRMKFLVYVLAGAITGFAAFINAIKVGGSEYDGTDHTGNAAGSGCCVPDLCHRLCGQTVAAGYQVNRIRGDFTWKNYILSREARIFMAESAFSPSGKTARR